MDANKYHNSGDVAIPDNVMELAYKGYAMRYGTQQSLDRIKERGGFSIWEILDQISYYLEHKPEKEEHIPVLMTKTNEEILTEIFHHKTTRWGRRTLGYTVEQETELYERILLAFDGIED